MSLCFLAFLPIYFRFHAYPNAFGIDDIADKYPTAVSGGQQQRASVARALSDQPAIIFADEPTKMQTLNGLLVGMQNTYIDGKTTLNTLWP